MFNSLLPRANNTIHLERRWSSAAYDIHNILDFVGPQVVLIFNTMLCIHLLGAFFDPPPRPSPFAQTSYMEATCPNTPFVPLKETRGVKRPFHVQNRGEKEGSERAAERACTFQSGVEGNPFPRFPTKHEPFTFKSGLFLPRDKT